MSSSINNPLEFFEDFFPDRFDKLHNDFFNFNTKKVSGTNDANYCEEPYYMVESNREKGYISIEEAAFANIDHETYQFKKYFYKELENTLRPEFENTLKQCINSLYMKDEKGQQAYVHTLLSHTEYLLKYQIPKINSKKYISLCCSYFMNFADNFAKRFPKLVESNTVYNKLQKEYHNNINHETLLIPPDKQPKIFRLYEKLKPKFIHEETTLEIFTKAFTGVELKETESLDIKWVLENNGHCFLGSLVIMLDYMVEVGCLNEYNDSLLSNIFVKNIGEYIIPSNWNKRRTDANKDKKKGEPLIFRELRGIIDTTIR